MIFIEQPFALEVNADTGAEIEQRLCEAFDTVLEHALERREGGILVTHHNHSRYTVAISAEVPFGLTIERQL